MFLCQISWNSNWWFSRNRRISEKAIPHSTVLFSLTTHALHLIFQANALYDWIIWHVTWKWQDFLFWAMYSYYRLVMKAHERGTKMVYKRVRGWTSGRAYLYEFVEYSPWYLILSVTVFFRSYFFKDWSRTQWQSYTEVSNSWEFKSWTKGQQHKNSFWGKITSWFTNCFVIRERLPGLWENWQCERIYRVSWRIPRREIRSR